VFLGIRTFLSKRKDSLVLFDRKGFWGAYVTAFVLALANPITIFAFIAAFAAFSLGHHLVAISALFLVLGVFLGSGAWFLALGFVAAFFRKGLKAGGLRWVNRIAGVLIVLSGAAAFVSLL
jgi:threonine/homoserine/homoserine lactone efflux protein